MKKIILLSILWGVLLSPVFAQQTLLTGQIIDVSGTPIPHVSICQDTSNHCSSSDFEGFFHLSILPQFPKQLKVQHWGYTAQTLKISTDSTLSFIRIKMQKDSSILETNRGVRGRYLRERKDWDYNWSVQLDFYSNKFDAFEDYIGEENVGLMNQTIGIINLELTGTYKRFFWGGSYGFIPNSDTTRFEYYKIEYNTTQIGLHTGYNIINSKRILLAPKANIRWMRYRLLNYDKEIAIPFNRYIIERDLDLRFNQIMGSIGGDLALKIYPKNTNTNYITLGIYGAYYFKLHGVPYIYTRRSEIYTEEKIVVNNYNFGIRIGFYY